MNSKVIFMTINEFVTTSLEDETPKALSDKLGVTTAMISTYKKSETILIPGIEVAKKLYKSDKIVLHPYSEDGILKEIEKGIKNGSSEK